MYKVASRFLQHRAVHTHDKKQLKKEDFFPPWMRKAKTKKIVKGHLVAKVEGGYIISIDSGSYHAFCPFCEMYPRLISKDVFNELKSQSFEYAVMEKKKNAIKVSRKRAVQLKSWKKIYNSLVNGEIIKGKVNGIKPFGVFIDIGGIDGLLHINRINDAGISDIKSFFKKGQIVSTVVSNIDKYKYSVYLSFRSVGRK